MLWYGILLNCAHCRLLLLAQRPIPCCVVKLQSTQSHSGHLPCVNSCVWFCKHLQRPTHWESNGVQIESAVSINHLRARQSCVSVTDSHWIFFYFYLYKKSLVFILKLCSLYWSITDWQCCNSCKWTRKQLSQMYIYIHTRIHSHPNSPPIQAATYHWAEFPVLYSRTLSVTHFRYSTLYVSIPNSLTNPSPHPSRLQM